MEGKARIALLHLRIVLAGWSFGPSAPRLFGLIPAFDFGSALHRHFVSTEGIQPCGPDGMAGGRPLVRENLR